jgi:hypothetical protein
MEIELCSPTVCDEDLSNRKYTRVRKFQTKSVLGFAIILATSGYIVCGSKQAGKQVAIRGSLPTITSRKELEHKQIDKINYICACYAHESIGRTEVKISWHPKQMRGSHEAGTKINLKIQLQILCRRAFVEFDSHAGSGGLRLRHGPRAHQVHWGTAISVNSRLARFLRLKSIFIHSTDRDRECYAVQDTQINFFESDKCLKRQNCR